MKNKILALALVIGSLSSFASVVSAGVDTPAHCGMQSDGVTIVECSSSNPENIVSPWGTNSSVPHLLPGTSSTDEYGVPVLCPIFTFTYCLDLTHTNYYRNQMIALAKMLIANGSAWEFPVFKGWVASVR